MEHWLAGGPGEGRVSFMTAGVARWEHFEHGADVGVRGYGATPAEAFEQAALALTAVVTEPDDVAAATEVELACEADDVELLLVDWLNAIVYEMSVNKLLFHDYRVELLDHKLRGIAWGETVDTLRHQPVVEIKGATYTELVVRQLKNDAWVAQTVIDV